MSSYIEDLPRPSSLSFTIGRESAFRIWSGDPSAQNLGDLWWLWTCHPSPLPTRFRVHNLTYRVFRLVLRRLRQSFERGSETA